MLPLQAPAHFSCYPVVSPSPASHRSHNVILILTNDPHHAVYDAVRGTSPTRSYSEWERDVMNTMVLDDDYYYVEFQDGSGNNSLVMKEHVDEMMMEENTDFEMDVDIESVQQSHEQHRVRLDSPDPRLTVVPSFLPIALSHRLCASHIADEILLDTNMEEEEDDCMDTDMDSVHQHHTQTDFSDTVMSDSSTNTIYTSPPSVSNGVQALPRHV
ncbi:hypothetical protein HDK77DRAFT_479189 [Phyllosticta capitalensis]